MKAAEAKKSQIDKFREAARELETDDSEEAFDRVLRKVGKAKPQEQSPRISEKKTGQT